MNDFLFVCQENRLRSPTCEHVARNFFYAADSAGTADTAIRPLTVDAIERARIVICMEEFHARCVLDLMANRSPFRMEIWHIPDIYDYCDPRLLDIARDKIKSGGYVHVR